MIILTNFMAKEDNFLKSEVDTNALERFINQNIQRKGDSDLRKQHTGSRNNIS